MVLLALAGTISGAGSLRGSPGRGRIPAGRYGRSRDR